eukprot:3777586-Pyramimonas_sp.AAC.1
MRPTGKGIAFPSSRRGCLNLCLARLFQKQPLQQAMEILPLQLSIWPGVSASALGALGAASVLAIC